MVFAFIGAIGTARRGGAGGPKKLRTKPPFDCDEEHEEAGSGSGRCWVGSHYYRAGEGEWSRQCWNRSHQRRGKEEC
jgi:hypothetical protein